jgi:diadenosine tetraphosphate (Ap4A) HIT family hydrolase
VAGERAGFSLHPRLAADTLRLGRFPLSLLLLMDDARYPWLLLVPERADVREIYELGPADRAQLLAESCHLAARLAAGFGAHKLNVAALGNVVPQLHLHHVVRYRHDAAWPHPVWGRGNPVPYPKGALAEVRARVTGLLAEGFVPAP